MKLTKRFIILIGLGIATLAVPILATSVASAESELSFVQISRCSDDGKRCLKAQSDHAVSGSFTQIFVMKNVTLSIQDKGGTKIKTFKGDSAYLDLDNEQLVLRNKTPLARTERVFDLKTMKDQTYVER